MKTYKIHLIRHGVTAANETGAYIGRTDLPLSQAGRKELIARREAGGYPAAARFFTSPLWRCRQTLDLLYPGCTATPVDGLAECDFGHWEGQTAAALQNDPDFHEWLCGRRTAIPGGEDAAAFQQRVTRAFEEVVRTVMREGSTEAVVCTHGGVIVMLMATYALPRRPLNAWAVANGCGYTLRVTPGIWMREPVAENAGEIPGNPPSHP